MIMESYLKSWSRKKWILWYRQQGGMMEQRDTACVFIFEILKSWMEEEVQFTNVCESAGFMRGVSVGMHYKTG